MVRRHSTMDHSTTRTKICFVILICSAQTRWTRSPMVRSDRGMVPVSGPDGLESIHPVVAWLEPQIKKLTKMQEIDRGLVPKIVRGGFYSVRIWGLIKMSRLGVLKLGLTARRG